MSRIEIDPESKITSQVVSLKENRLWQGIPGIEISPKGRLWITFFSGGPHEPHTDNYIMITSSKNFLQSNNKPQIDIEWEKPKKIFDPEPGTRAYDPTLWHDPSGILWLIHNQGTRSKRLHEIRYIQTSESDLSSPKWTESQTIPLPPRFVFRMNKPTILSSGEWILPVTWAKNIGWLSWLSKTNRQGVAISEDNGRTWKLSGNIYAPSWALENMILERHDGMLWNLIRTGSGVLWESISMDKGKTWSKGQPTKIVNPGSRFHIRRLQSGNILLINHPIKKARTGLYAAISRDDGKSFENHIELTNKPNVSYPDAIQDQYGRIHIVYDRERKKLGEINYVCLTEKSFDF